MFGKLKASLKKTFVPPDEKAALNAPEGVVRPKVFFDIKIGEQGIGRIVMELFTDITPQTCENFLQLCKGVEPGGESYRGALFHRIPEFVVQGGDIVNGNGTGVWSIYGGGAFPDENFKVKHKTAGLLSMANSGPNTNGCQFFITVAPADFLDGKHVVFGRVVDGMNVVKRIEGTPTGTNDRPQTRVCIAACGTIE